MKRLTTVLFAIILLCTISFSSYGLDYTQVQIDYNISTRTVSPQYIVIHDTANLNTYANAWMHYLYFDSGNQNASADIFIDTGKIYFINNIDKYYTWHCGDNYNYHSKVCFNYNSIGIEMCMNDTSTKGKQTVFWKTVETTKYLMNKYKIPLTNVLRHYDVTHKFCPGTYPFVDSSPYINPNWIQFKNALVSLAPVTPYDTGINKCVEKGYMSSPGFWKNIESKSKDEVIKYTKQLITNIGYK